MTNPAKPLLALSMVVLCTLSVAQNTLDDNCLQFYCGPTLNLVASDLMESSLYPNAGLRLGVNTRPETSSPYAAHYGYPTIGLDIGWHDLEYLRYHNGSHLENIVTLSGFIERPIRRWTKTTLAYGFNLGAGFNSAVYDIERNPLNTHFSSPLLIYVSGGLIYKRALSEHWELGGALRLSHFSTGRLAYPNTGLNLMNLEVSMRYAPHPPYRPTPGDNPRPDIAHSRFHAELALGGGLHRCATEWRAFGSTSPWPNYTQSVALFWRYTPTLSTGLGIDAVFATAPFLERIEEAERQLYGDEAVDASPGYDRISTGLALTQQFHYGNFALFGTFGYYLHRQMGVHEQEGLFYQKAGIKLYIPRLKGIFLSADCLAHSFSRAALIEFSVGYRI